MVREAKRDAREAATRALAERSRADASLRRETVRARSARASRRHESVVEDIVRPRERDAVTGALIDRSGEYRRLGARDRRLGAPPASGKNAPDAPVAVTFRVLTVHDERASEAHRSSPNAGSVRSTRTRTNDETQKKETASHELKTTRVRESARRDFTTACSKPHPDFDRDGGGTNRWAIDRAIARRGGLELARVPVDAHAPAASHAGRASRAGARAGRGGALRALKKDARRARRRARRQDPEVRVQFRGADHV